jgi:hypothetical protein
MTICVVDYTSKFNSINADLRHYPTERGGV